MLPPVERDVVILVENEFGFASMKVVFLPVLYGGKLCAALDRQHPGDLFDIKVLLENQNIDRALFNGFITYFLSHKRPISEIMNNLTVDSMIEEDLIGNNKITGAIIRKRSG